MLCLINLDCSLTDYETGTCFYCPDYKHLNEHIIPGLYEILEEYPEGSVVQIYPDIDTHSVKWYCSLKHCNKIEGTADISKLEMKKIQDELCNSIYCFVKGNNSALGMLHFE